MTIKNNCVTVRTSDLLLEGEAMPTHLRLNDSCGSGYT